MVALLISLAILLLSVILHELGHGVAAYIQGDMTARDAGRLTLNPIPHIDPIGTLILPAALIALKSGFIFGWAKPVPYNPYNLRWGVKGEALVAFAGAFVNIALALLGALLLMLLGNTSNLVEPILTTAIFLNLLLAVINLIPIPPLDGYKVLTQLLPEGGRTALLRFETNMNEKISPMGALLLTFLILYLFLTPLVGFVWYLTELLII